MSRAIIIHTPSDTRASDKSYSSIGRAKAVMTRNPDKYPSDEYQAVDFNEWDTEIEVINLMTKQPVKILKSQRGGACDPSTERYWSM